MSCQARLWFSDAVLCEVSSETRPGWEGARGERGRPRQGETTRERERIKRTEEQERGLGGGGEGNKSKGGSDISSNEEHGGWCRGGHHDITICKSTAALLLPQIHSEQRSVQTESQSQPGPSSSEYILPRCLLHDGNVQWDNNGTTIIIAIIIIRTAIFTVFGVVFV